MDENISIRPGDIFCTSFPGAIISKAIKRAEKRQSKDNEAELTHSGFIVDSKGLTFEALSRYKHQNIWDAYGGKEVKLLIGRHKLMDGMEFFSAYTEIKRIYSASRWMTWVKPDICGYRGKIYPAWRLLMHEIPGLAKFSIGPAVCSEITMRMLNLCGLSKAWKGWNPDDVADMIVRFKTFDIIYHKNIESYDSAYLNAGGEQ